jgi:hypothetical protein
MTRFWLQVADREGVVWNTPFGSPMERDLIEACTAAIVAKATISAGGRVIVSKAAIAQGITETVQALKRETVSVA